MTNSTSLGGGKVTYRHGLSFFSIFVYGAYDSGGIDTRRVYKSRYFAESVEVDSVFLYQ